MVPSKHGSLLGPISSGGRTRGLEQTIALVTLFVMLGSSDRVLSAPNRATVGKQLMTVSQLADYLDVSRSALYSVIGEGAGFPAYKVGSRWYADLDEVQEWLLRVCEKEGTSSTKTCRIGFSDG